MHLSLHSPLNLPALLWGSHPIRFGSGILTDVQTEEFLQSHGREWDYGVGYVLAIAGCCQILAS